MSGTRVYVQYFNVRILSAFSCLATNLLRAPRVRAQHTHGAYLRLFNTIIYIFLAWNSKMFECIANGFAKYLHRTQWNEKKTNNTYRNMESVELPVAVESSVRAASVYIVSCNVISIAFFFQLNISQAVFLCYVIFTICWSNFGDHLRQCQTIKFDNSMQNFLILCIRRKDTIYCYWIGCNDFECL